MNQRDCAAIATLIGTTDASVQRPKRNKRPTGFGASR